MTPPPAAPLSLEAERDAGRAVRGSVPRDDLARRIEGPRDALGILAAQNARRLADLVSLRTERMSASAFAFYRGTAALMAADLARDPSTGLLVVSCGDAHVANLGFYGSRERTLVFDLNDFDEAAWAPWEWDVKRLVTSVVIGGRATSRKGAVVVDAAKAVVHGYTRSLSTLVERSPLERYYEHFNATAAADGRSLDSDSRSVLRAAIEDAERRTGQRAVRRLTVRDDAGRLRFVERPPTMRHVPHDEDQLRALATRYAATTSADIQVLLSSYRLVDVCLRVVGVGSVGTRCYLLLYEDGDGNALILQAKEAGASVLEEYGGVTQPALLDELVSVGGQGSRVVSGQRVLQAVSDPFLGHLRHDGVDFYVRQFHDLKGGIEVEPLADRPFRLYAEACGVVLARAHAQSPGAGRIAGYLGRGRRVADAILEWSQAYADVSRGDYEAFLSAHRADAPAAER